MDVSEEYERGKAFLKSDQAAVFHCARAGGGGLRTIDGRVDCCQSKQAKRRWTELGTVSPSSGSQGTPT